MPSSLLSCVIQLDAGLDRSANLEKATRFVTQACEFGAKLITLPELFNYRGPDYQGEVIGAASPSLSPFFSLSHAYHAWILAGSICELDPDDPMRLFNTSVLISPDGHFQIYRKIHLFDAELSSQSIQESHTFCAGVAPTLASLGPHRLGMSVCYDLRFPSLFSWYADKGADIISIPSSFTYETGKAHWITLLRARAIENQCFVIAPNQVGVGTRGIQTYGHSAVVDPWGRVLIEGDDHSEGPLYAELSFPELETVRQKIPKASAKFSFFPKSGDVFSKGL